MQRTNRYVNVSIRSIDVSKCRAASRTIETQCRREVSELMAANLEVVGSENGLAVLYFHGAASVRDFGPSDELCIRSGIRLFRFCRPGYDNSAARPSASLIDVAKDALSILVSMGIESVVVLGWSGGGPYALASVFAKTHIRSRTTRPCLVRCERSRFLRECLYDDWRKVTRRVPARTSRWRPKAQHRGT